MGNNVESRLSEMLPAQLGELSILERKVSTYLLKHEDRLMGMDIAEIAKASGVSKATVVRFCKALGFQGLKDFKIYYEAGKSQYSIKITKLSEGVSSADVMETMKNGFIRAIEKSSTEENLLAIDNIAKDIDERKKIAILFDGDSSNSKALSDRLESLGYESLSMDVNSAISDSFFSDVLIVVSPSGDINGLGPYCKKARENGSKIECVTSNPKSWVAVNADNVISLFNEKLLSDDKYILSECAISALFETLYVILKINK